MKKDKSHEIQLSMNATFINTFGLLEKVGIIFKRRKFVSSF